MNSGVDRKICANMLIFIVICQFYNVILLIAEAPCKWAEAAPKDLKPAT